uniref:Uncharacterized protein n=1 Tax=Aegilops tauschii subsp. strangulata TaxID=200361 RepID=A0A453PWX2_AEGTS
MSLLSISSCYEDIACTLVYSCYHAVPSKEPLLYATLVKFVFFP